MLLLFVHFPLKPFDLKEVDIMVSFPDRYPMQVRAAASIKYTHFYEVYYSCFGCKCFLITLKFFFLEFHFGYTIRPGSATSDGKVNQSYHDILNV